MDFAKEEGLHQAIVVKLSMRSPDLSILRLILPKFLGIKGHCPVGFLAQRQLLIRMDQYDDFVAALSRGKNYFMHNGKIHQIRIFSWNIGFNPKEETSRAAVWISFLNLSTDLFAKRSLISIASAVGKPIVVDKATQVRSRPSTARVRVILDLMDKHPDVFDFKVWTKLRAKLLRNFRRWCMIIHLNIAPIQHAASLICPVPVLKPLMATLDASACDIPSPSMESIGGLLAFNFLTLFSGRASYFQFHHPIPRAISRVAISSLYYLGDLLTCNFITLFFKRAPDLQFPHFILRARSRLSISSPYSSSELSSCNFFTLFLGRAPDLQFHRPVLQVGS
ncbi:hypothetical protein BC332_19377 [Capsicum chinense]|nr:hypothetical protein BC332_19377 [Capsicum chinense]